MIFYFSDVDSATDSANEVIKFTPKEPSSDVTSKMTSMARDLTNAAAGISGSNFRFIMKKCLKYMYL